ncbi:hypothetical protein TrST_g4694 [Triparma strigata]|uniref:Uncharacterized protein n=1 Tax=Triparma strigata TaxID=1606541 RepID=A0A9W7AD56_9STRA|nr:hypothetical protein TrST_g4694 [Triparma strigata]
MGYLQELHEVATSILASPIDPYAKYYRKFYELSPEQFAEELFKGDAEASMESYQQWSVLKNSVFGSLWRWRCRCWGILWGGGGGLAKAKGIFGKAAKRVRS